MARSSTMSRVRCLKSYKRNRSIMKKLGKDSCLFPITVSVGMKYCHKPYPSKLLLALAMPATIALLTTLFIDHRVAAALWAEIARYGQMCHIQRAGRSGMFLVIIAMTVPVAVPIAIVVLFCLLFLFYWK